MTIKKELQTPSGLIKKYKTQGNYSVKNLADKAHTKVKKEEGLNLENISNFINSVFKEITAENDRILDNFENHLRRFILQKHKANELINYPLIKENIGLLEKGDVKDFEKAWNFYYKFHGALRISLSNSDKNRVGKYFVQIIENILTDLSIEFEKPVKTSKKNENQGDDKAKADIVIPRESNTKEYPHNTAVVNITTTLKERYRSQINILDNYPGANQKYILSLAGNIIDKDQPDLNQKVTELKPGSYLVVTSNVLETNNYSSNNKIIDFEEFFRRVLEIKKKDSKKVVK